MGTASLVGAWLASMAPLVLESGGWLDLDGGSRLALALLPWLALAGLPRGVATARPPPKVLLARSLGPLAHALPVLCAAGALDHAAHHAGLARTALPGAGLLVLLALAAESARHGELRRGLHGALWLVLVPGGALLALALGWGASPGQGDLPFAVSAVAQASPLGWALGRVPAGEVPSAAPLLAALVLAALAFAPLPLGAVRRPAGLLLSLFLAATPAAAQHARRGEGSRIAFARVELVGPLDGLVLDAGRAGTTRVEGPGGALVRGEQRTVLLPVPVLAPGAPPAPEIEVSSPTGPDGGGAARFLAWVQPEDYPIALVLKALFAGPLPELGPRSGGASPALLLWLGFVFAAGLAARRRVRVELAVALGGTLVGVALVVVRAEGRGAELRLVAGAVGRTWLELSAAGDVLAAELDPDSVVRLGAPAAPVQLHVGLDFDTRGLVRIECPGGTVTVARALDPGARRIERGINAWGDFAAAWTRAGDGTWSAHGPWRLGTALPAEQAGARDPPGWLLAALPMGRSVFLGCEAPSVSGGAGPERWVRLLDFQQGP